MLEYKGKSIRKNITLYQDDIKKLEALMKKYKINCSEVIRQLINSEFEKKKKS